MSASGFTPIQLYFSTTASATPSAGNLANGELAINITDGKLYYKDNGGVVKLLASNAGSSGDVVGPSSATDNALVRFDTTTGKLVQNSVGILSDAGDLSGIAALSMSGALTLSGGTANGVAYLNGSKVLTTGSALTFDGNGLSVGTGAAQSVSTINGGSTGGAIKGQRAGVNQWFVGDVAAALGSGTGLINFLYNNDPFVWYSNSNEQMRLTSTGLGIGTSSPGAKLDVRGNANFSGNATSRQTANFINTGGELYVGVESSSGGAVFVGSSAYASIVGSNNATPLQLGTNGTIKATLDSSGNLGLGVTPSAWQSGVKAFQNGAGALYTVNTVQQRLSLNAYRDSAGTMRYINSSIHANEFRMGEGDGSFQWYTAPSGTAGNAISFTQAMTLSSTSLDVNSGYIKIGSPGTSTDEFWLQPGSTEFALRGRQSKAMTFYTSDVERARIDSSGNLLVGTTTATHSGITSRCILKSSDNILGVVTDSGNTQAVRFTNGTTAVGSINLTTSTTAYSTSSDYRLKNTIAPMTGALAKVALLKPCTYKWNADGSDGEGFIAHELAEVVPQCVTGAKDAVDAEGKPQYQGIDTSFLVATLTAALQELKAINDAQALTIASLTARLDAANL